MSCILTFNTFSPGWVYDITHRYEEAFLLGGGLTILSAVILICIPVLTHREKTQMYNPTVPPSIIVKVSDNNNFQPV